MKVNDWEKNDYLALDTNHQVVARDSSSEGARFKAIALGIEDPIVIPALYVDSGLIRLNGVVKAEERKVSGVNDTPFQSSCENCQRYNKDEWHPNFWETLFIVFIFALIVSAFVWMVHTGYFANF